MSSSQGKMVHIDKTTNARPDDVRPFLKAINRYISAKDNNKPHLLTKVFTEASLLEMKVNTDSISFPSDVVGVEAISHVLSSQFNQRFENVYTFCLSDSIVRDDTLLTCKWLVVMTEKDNGTLRIGCGYYDWLFNDDSSISAKDPKVDKLTITIDYMAAIHYSNKDHLLDGIGELPYPWCFSSSLSIEMPMIEDLKTVRRFLEQD
ncbi:hypothetical protein [Grimontia sedimenti]|nr:hypothetical protein [Grimontia sedimenti]